MSNVEVFLGIDLRGNLYIPRDRQFTAKQACESERLPTQLALC
jgi:hypothetical protein